MEELMRDGDLALKDFDGNDLDPITNDRLYCIVYVDADGSEHELMLLWRRGKTLRSRSLPGEHGGFETSVANLTSLMRLVKEANRLLGDSE